MSKRLLPFARRFIRNLKGNVAIIFALSLIPIVFLAGMALDFTSATQKRARLNAAADAAALAAVTPKMASQSIAAAQAVAQAVFVGEASTVKGLSYSNPNINIVQNGLVRTATVTYTAASANAFQGILGQPAWAISGSSTATSSYSPNITLCTKIKQRRIFIAVLYTEYLPLPTNSWYNDWIAPFQSDIEPNMESCASPGLFFQVTTDGDITAAMQTLFQETISSARLSQ
jgi:Flp pilus assembly protein TadG